MLYDCMHGDASLFSRSDWVETAWQIVQPVLDEWSKTKELSFPNYPFGSWGPKEAFELLNHHNRRWHAPSPTHAIKRAPMFSDCNDIMEKHDFCKVLMDRPQFAEHLIKIANECYNVVVNGQERIDMTDQSVEL